MNVKVRWQVRSRWLDYLLRTRWFPYLVVFSAVAVAVGFIYLLVQASGQSYTFK